MDKETRYSKTSTMSYKILATIVLFLGLCMTLEAKRFDEADCRPRQVPVPVSEDHRYKPYNVVLYRCTGTFNRISPSIKHCIAINQHEVTVDVQDEHGSNVRVKLTNHTVCGGQCTISSCGKNMYMKDCECRCFPGMKDCDTGDMVIQTPAVDKSKREQDKTIPLPYLIGMAVVGLFAVFVLVFDAMLCVKSKGFMSTIKHSCCAKSKYPDKNKNQPKEESQGMVSAVSNGKVTDV